ncbi:glutathione synthetase ATP-binding domain-like protein, partial [Aureobasidium sp. EXF-8845]
TRALWQCFRTTVVSGPGVERVVRLIVPLQAEYIVRSDTIPLHLQDFEHIETAMLFADPLQAFTDRNIASGDADNIESLFSAAPAVLVLEAPDTEIGKLENRLSFLWILPEPVQEKTLILMNPNSAKPAKGGSGSAPYVAAQAPGIKLVVFDNYAHWHGAFVLTRLINPPERDLTDTLLNSIREYGRPIDGIITFAGSYWIDAARQIAVPTAPAKALKTATNKYLMNKFVGHEAYRASNLAEALKIADEVELPHLLIVSPAMAGAQRVSRVD